MHGETHIKKISCFVPETTAASGAVVIIVVIPTFSISVVIPVLPPPLLSLSP